MKHLSYVLLLLLFWSCSKEEMQQNAVISAMTTGQWKVVTFIDGTDTLTSQFSSHRFQFNKDYTVDAYKLSVLEKKGNWNADANARTITSTFISANNPVSYLNGTWKITRNSWNYVEASQPSINGERRLRLEKY